MWNVRIKYRKEEDRVIEQYLIELLANLIFIHYKYFKNISFDTFNQYCNSYSTKIYNQKERIKLYDRVNEVLQKKYKLFFAHINLDDSIYLIDVSKRCKYDE